MVACQTTSIAVTGQPRADLMGTAEIAALLGVSRQRVLQLLREQPDFPQPVAVLKMGNVWDAAEVRQWAAGRPPRS